MCLKKGAVYRKRAQAAIEATPAIAWTEGWCASGAWQAPKQPLSRRHAAAGEQGRRIRELTSVVQKRWKFEDGQVELFAEKVMDRGLCAVAQAESLRYKLLGGLAVRRCAVSSRHPCSVRERSRSACCSNLLFEA